MAKIIAQLPKLPKIFKNLYFLLTASFFVWMLLFDSNDFITQYQRRAKLKALEQEKQYYLGIIEEVKKERKELFTNPALLEKFAREKYLLRKPNEEVYVIVEE